MELIAEKSKIVNHWNILLDDENIVWDWEIAQYLNLTIEEYRDILIQNGGQFRTDGYVRGIDTEWIDFKSECEAKFVIGILEPYLIMSNLIGE